MTNYEHDYILKFYTYKKKFEDNTPKKFLSMIKNTVVWILTHSSTFLYSGL